MSWEWNIFEDLQQNALNYICLPIYFNSNCFKGYFFVMEELDGGRNLISQDFNNS